MAKNGIFHDYDLHANLEGSAQNQECVICGKNPMSFQWSDYSGEGMCQDCGCPYQLKWGSDKQKEEGNYPYLNLKKEYIPILKEYWNEHHNWTYLGRSLGYAPGLEEFGIWVEKYYDENLNRII